MFARPYCQTSVPNKAPTYVDTEITGPCTTDDNNMGSARLSGRECLSCGPGHPPSVGHLVPLARYPGARISALLPPAAVVREAGVRWGRSKRGARSRCRQGWRRGARLRWPRRGRSRSTCRPRQVNGLPAQRISVRAPPRDRCLDLPRPARCSCRPAGRPVRCRCSKENAICRPSSSWPSVFYWRAFEIVGRLAFARTWSAVLVQTKAWERSFQPSMKVRILALRSRTALKTSRRMAAGHRQRAGPPRHHALTRMTELRSGKTTRHPPYRA